MKRWLIGLAIAAGTGAATVAADALTGGGVSVTGAALAVVLGFGALKGVLMYLKSEPIPKE